MIDRLSSVGRALLVTSATTLALILSAPAYAGEPSSTPADEAVPADQVAIAVATSNGSGCEANTADVEVLPRNGGFTVTYHTPYAARTGAGSDPTDFRKNCQVSLSVDRPDGWTYAVSSASHRGFASLRAGATGLQRWSHYIQGSSTTRSADHNFAGPYRDFWRTFDQVDQADLLFSPCDAERNLNVNTELRVSAGTSAPDGSIMAADSSDDDVDSVYRFTWKRCP